MLLIVRFLFAALLTAVTVALTNQLAGLPVLTLDAASLLLLVSITLGVLISPMLSVFDIPLPALRRSTRETGQVKWFNVSKGYGFITRDSGDDVFVHFRSIRGRGRRSLYEGQTVEFELTQGEKGPQAEDVSVLEDSPRR